MSFLYWMVFKTASRIPWFIYIFTPVCAICNTVIFAIVFNEIVTVYETSNAIEKEWRMLARENFWGKMSGTWMKDRVWLQRKIVSLRPIFFSLSGFVKPKRSTRVKHFQAIVEDLTEALLLVPIEIVMVYENSNDIGKRWKVLARENFWGQTYGPWMKERAWLRRKILALKPIFFTLSGLVQPKRSTRMRHFQAIIVDLTNALLLVPM
ncbi:unnamed protein product [Orchesella dallaii]|uniref:Uncharacterized protein n=1 Tax=Orchesella dallaii TaxID=48710 RepID=A0ABP1R6E9_9HEXA